MSDSRLVLLKTRAFSDFINARTQLLGDYEDIKTAYDSIVKDLLANWQGRGADAFSVDSAEAKANLNGLFDILKTMCDTLIECRDVFEECDTRLGQSNRSAFD